MPSKETLEKLIDACKIGIRARMINQKPGKDAVVEQICGVHYWVCPYLNTNLNGEITCPFAENIDGTNRYQCTARYKKP
ncbi:MAG: hypothetical protein Q8O88_01130 [bacterium]|nr:hypothetical protein [bacterium]